MAGGIGSYGRRKVIAHACYGILGNEPCAILDYIGLGPCHAGRPVSYHRYLVLGKGPAQYIVKLVYVYRFIGTMGSKLIPVYTVMGSPVSTGLPPVHARKPSSALEYYAVSGSISKPPQPVAVSVLAAMSRISKLIQLFKKGRKQISGIGVDRHIHMDRRLLELFLIYVTDHGVGLPCPGGEVVAHLPDIEP